MMEHIYTPKTLGAKKYVYTVREKQTERYKTWRVLRHQKRSKQEENT